MKHLDLSFHNNFCFYIAPLKSPNLKYKVIILFCLFFLLHPKNNLLAQNEYKIDSLKAVISIETNKERQVDIFNDIADLYSLYQIDSALIYAEQGLKLAEQINYKQGEADSHFQLSYYYDRASNVKQAIAHMEKACQVYTALGDSSYLPGCYNNLGVYYSYGTEQKKSLEYFIKALELAQKLNETYSLSEAYYNIGTFYEYVNENGLALKYYQKALEIDTSQNNLADISWSFINLGNINMKLHRFDDAWEYLLKARKTLTEVRDQYNNIQLNLSFAYYFLEKNELDSVEVHIDKAKEIYRKHKFERLKADIIAAEADFLLAKKQYTQSIQLYNKAVEIYNQQNTTDGLWDIYTSKAKAFEKMGQLDRAYLALQKANQINDAIKPNEIAKVLGEFEQKEATKDKLYHYRLEQELLNQKEEADLLRIRSKFHYAIFSIVFLVIWITLAVYLYVTKRKNNKLLESNLTTINQQKQLLEEQYQKLEERENKLRELNATKDKFFSILAHDLKNPFNTLMGLSEIIISDKNVRNSDQFDEFIEGIFQTALSGYNLLENLLEWSRSQTGNIGVYPQPVSIEEVIGTNIHFFHEILKEKKIEVVAPDLKNYKVLADKNMVNLIVRNILNNAIKFSFPEGKIELLIHQKDSFYIIHVQDNGIGMNPDTVSKLFKIDQAVQRNGTAGEKGTGLGLILCKEFVNKNGGDIWVESTKGKGSRFSFSLPVFNKK